MTASVTYYLRCCEFSIHIFNSIYVKYTLYNIIEGKQIGIVFNIYIIFGRKDSNYVN